MEAEKFAKDSRVLLKFLFGEDSYFCLPDKWSKRLKDLTNASRSLRRITLRTRTDHQHFAPFWICQ